MDAIVKQVSEYVEKLFQDYSNPNLYYHNISHTRSVVNHVSEISQRYQLSSKDKMISVISAWFHDVGYLISGMYEHERKSVDVMKLFLLNLIYDEDVINRIASCIMSTKLPVKPDNLLEKILCDADTYHLGTEHFWKSDIAVRKEAETIAGAVIIDWDKKTLIFLREHQYFTHYCKQLLAKGKQDNIMRLSEKIT